MPKFQFVLDPLLAQGLDKLPGRNKTDKIRQALCLKMELQKMLREEPQDRALVDLEQRAYTRYQTAYGKDK
jgi:hypothetical protein